MQLSRLFTLLLSLLLPIALLSTTWLYLYPIFHACAFPSPHAPFRLLALGDPQLEGDSSLPDPNAPVFPSLEYFLQDLETVHGVHGKIDVLRDGIEGVWRDGKKWLEGRRKAVDLWGNDRYLAHIVRTTRWWSGPTHVAVLGDLLGSQWITDGEFDKRAGRYWDVVMKGLERVPESVYARDEEEGIQEDRVENDVDAADVKSKGKKTDGVEVTQEGMYNTHEGPDSGQRVADETRESDDVTKEMSDDAKEALDTTGEVSEPHVEETKPLRKPLWGGTMEVLGDDKSWANRVINIAGNHDVGYAGDLDESRITRFEKAFGSVNWDIWFTLPSDLKSTDEPPALRLVILNTMNVDTPAWSGELQTETYSFMNHIITSSRDVSDKTHATVLLTHIPLEKEAGVCVDSPLFSYFDDGQGICEQNMLSEYSSKTILQGIFGMSDYQFAAGQGFGRHGIILNGHDHEGCDVTHFVRQDGVNEACDIDTVKREDAHWPKVLYTPLPPTMSTPAPESYDMDPISPLAKDMTCAVPVIEEPPAPEPVKKGWRAHRFPHRPYSILHDPVENTTSCTNIDRSPHIREITLRSMMGDFSGHAGFLSAYFDHAKGDRGEWVFEFASCGVGVQHWWWAVHSIDFALLVIAVLAALNGAFEKRKRSTQLGGTQMSSTKAKGNTAMNGR